MTDSAETFTSSVFKTKSPMTKISSQVSKKPYSKSLQHKSLQEKFDHMYGYRVLEAVQALASQGFDTRVPLENIQRLTDINAESLLRLIAKQKDDGFVDVAYQGDGQSLDDFFVHLTPSGQAFLKNMDYLVGETKA